MVAKLYNQLTTKKEVNKVSKKDEAMLLAIQAYIEVLYAERGTNPKISLSSNREKNTLQVQVACLPKSKMRQLYYELRFR